MWDPSRYLRYRDERARPFHDLLARLPASAPRTVVDLGCGPGNLTTTLAQRWPQARVTGLDSSPEMIDKALELGSGIEFAVGDVRDWVPDPTVDVVVSNAVLQWVPGHEELLVRWAAQLPAGAWLAVQVPGNFDAASHRALRAVAEDPRWRERLVPLLRSAPVSDPIGYAALLTGAGCAVDAWETTYVHLLPADQAADHPALTWMEGTALRPVRASLGGDTPAWADFRATLGAQLAEAYPVRDGLVYFPFRRHFFVAQTGARAVADQRPAVRENP
ncbi:trans-aconitate 2-methyltransferase [Micromonospora pisi]|uniref:Trans-aconitate 2-methyltransferase n=1 Tax=Micromonospora pisi TaxID=589240 RepID=A0A495JT88_9ACTN|nr:trans-aconitate 2-methyltransferase [Micromonospora pisi]RKR91574.1 trans-aconitate 2-methyltransferase [Micromonospora pisi]